MAFLASPDQAVRSRNLQFFPCLSSCTNDEFNQHFSPSFASGNQPNLNDSKPGICETKNSRQASLQPASVKQTRGTAAKRKNNKAHTLIGRQIIKGRSRSRVPRTLIQFSPT